MPITLDGTGSITGLTATGISAVQQLPSGSVLQVVQSTYSTQASNSTITLTDSGVTATITPKFSSSKILVLVTINGLYNAQVAGNGTALAILRNSTNLNAFCNYTNYITPASGLITSASANYLDSPATTSATVYKVQFARNGGSGTIGVQWNSDVSSITLLEISG